MPRIEQVWIPMPDGVRLAADLYWPADVAHGDRYPVLLEYLPYRKDESRARNVDVYAYFLAHGYVVARVDIRGTGASEGRLIPYEYSDIELDDGESVIAWLASQPWSSGNVGMFGISWGGFNAIQMAARAPPALKAFIALMATEDLYQDDVHYMDGIMHVDSWMMSQDLYNSLPAAPAYRLDGAWRRNRFDVEPSIFEYMRQQRDGPFWDRASTRDRLHELKVPGFHIGGWYDGYRDSVPRMLEGVTAPVKGLLGAWDHFLPHDAWPGPDIEWRAEAVRWFDQFLRARDTGILEEPKLAYFLRDWHPPDPGIEKVTGQWRWLDDWPPPGQSVRVLHAGPGGGLNDTPVGGPAWVSLPYTASSGVEGGGPVMWWGSIAPDQSPLDELSLVFDSEPLETPVEIVGFPRAKLRVSADAPRANWVARLSDVAPDGRVTQVTGAAFNGAHRHSARDPRDLENGVSYDLDIEMHVTSWVFPAGHRIRLAVNNAQWPMLWPTPYAMTTRLALGGEAGAKLELPLAPKPTARPPAFAAPEPAPRLPGFATLDAGNVTGYGEVREVVRDPETGDALVVAENSGGQRYPWGEERFEERIEHRTNDRDPSDTSMRGRYAIEVQLSGRLLRFEAEIDFSSDRDNFSLGFVKRVIEDRRLVVEREWHETLPRDHQ